MSPSSTGRRPQDKRATGPDLDTPRAAPGTDLTIEESDPSEGSAEVGPMYLSLQPRPHGAAADIGTNDPAGRLGLAEGRHLVSGSGDLVRRRECSLPSIIATPHVLGHRLA